MNQAPNVTVSRCPFSQGAKNFDAFDPAFLHNPFPALKEIRETEPIFFDEKLGYWVVTRADYAKLILRNSIDFSADIVLNPIVPLYPSTIQKFIESGFNGASGGSLVNDINPIHDERRKWLAKTLTPQRLKEMEPYVRATVAKAVDAFVKKGEIDLVKHLASEVPTIVLLTFLGIPLVDVDRVKTWAEPTTMFSWGKPTEQEQNHMADMLGEYWQYAKQHVANLRNNLGNDVVSEAIRGQQAQGLWTDEELTTMVINFTFAGHESTTNTTSNAFLALLQHPEAWDELCANPTLIPNAIEECIRFSPSVISHRRRAVNAINIGGADIAANDQVLIYLASANRDEEVFANSETFNIHREGPNRHISFGFGWHSCLGAPLARLELRLMMEEMTSRLPHMRLKPDQQFKYLPINSTMRGPDKIIAQWDPAQNPRPEDRP